MPQEEWRAAEQEASPLDRLRFDSREGNEENVRRSDRDRKEEEIQTTSGQNPQNLSEKQAEEAFYSRQLHEVDGNKSSETEAPVERQRSFEGNHEDEKICRSQVVPRRTWSRSRTFE